MARLTPRPPLVPPEISPYRSEIEDLHVRAAKFVSQRDSNFPAFSSFSHIEQMRNQLTIESLTLRHYIGKPLLQINDCFYWCI